MAERPHAERLLDLPALERAVWAELSLATHQRGHAWRVMTLATVNGDRAAARSVVVREVLDQERQLLVYCDARSAKVAQIGQHPLGTLVAWSPALSWQLRLEVDLSVADSGLAVASRWAQVQLTARTQDYLAARPPGTPVDSFEPERDTREHFGVITAQVTAVDWLELNPLGNRRARFDTVGGRWLVP